MQMDLLLNEGENGKRQYVMCYRIDGQKCARMYARLTVTGCGF